MASSYQTLANVYSDVRTAVQKDSTTLTDATLLRLANKYFLRMVRALIDLKEDLYAEISFTDLVADQEEYPLPTDDTSSTYGDGLIKLERVELTYDGSRWQVADPMSYQELAGPSILDADKNTNKTKDNPKYAFKDRSIFIFPVPSSNDSVTAGNKGLYIFWIKRPQELTGTSSIPNIPKDFLDVLAEGMLIDAYRQFGRMGDSAEARNNWRIGIQEMKELEQAPDQEHELQFVRVLENYK